MTLTDSIDAVLIDRSAHYVFPMQFIWLPQCGCDSEAEPEECHNGHLICGQCGQHMVEARI